MSAPSKYLLPHSLHGTRSYGKKTTTVEITSDYDIVIVVYTDRSSSYTRETFTAIPFSQLGNEYFVMSYVAYKEGFVLISAPGEPCFVNITCKHAVEYDGGKCKRGKVLNVELGSYESIQLKTKHTDVTGTHITTNISVSIIVGAVCTYIPRGTPDCNTIIEQLIPFDRWGRSFILTPLYRRLAGYVFQVLAGRDNTRLSLMTSTSNDSLELHEGQYHMFDVTEQLMYYLEADRPLSVMQYSKGYYTDGRPGDPAMLRVPPLLHYVHNATFPVIGFEQSPLHLYLAIIITKSSACDKHDLIVQHDYIRQEVKKKKVDHTCIYIGEVNQRYMDPWGTMDIRVSLRFIETAQWAPLRKTFLIIVIRGKHILGSISYSRRKNKKNNSGSSPWHQHS